jgi:hypothetical protein
MKQKPMGAKKSKKRLKTYAKALSTERNLVTLQAESHKQAHTATDNG